MLNVSQPVVPNAKGTPIVFQAANPAVLWATLPEKTDSDVIFRITVYSHHFKVVPLTDIARKICFSFVRRYIISSTTGPEPVHTAYASSNTAKTWFRFHINTLDDWKRFIYEKGYSKAAEYTEKEYFTPTKVALALKDGWKHKPEQEPVRDYLAAPVGVKDPQSGLYPEGTGAKARLVGISTGAGKALTLESKIKIPSGWSTMGEMKVGTKVVAPDGTTTVVTGVYPQGELEVFKVSFSDGREVECCADHLWKVYYIPRKKDDRWVVVKTSELPKMIADSGRRVYIELITPEEGVDIDLPIHPYLLGYLLGNGSMILPSCFRVTTRDQEIIEKLQGLLPKNLELKYLYRYDYQISRKLKTIHGNELMMKLRQLGLMGKRSFEKFIPANYLNGSYKQRLELVQGLMDSDGTIDLHSVSSFCSSSYQLAKDFQYLIRSLGGVSKISVKEAPRYIYKNKILVGRNSYNVSARITKPSRLFSLLRKKERAKDDGQYANKLKLRMESVVSSRKAQAQCISVDHPDRLYITNDFIVTHNTFCALAELARRGEVFVAIVLAQFVGKWVNDIANTLKVDKKEILKVQGSAELKALTEMAVTKGALEGFKAIVISNRTYENYLRSYERHENELQDLGYMCKPEELFEKLGAGTRLIDEVHMQFYAQYRLDLYTHVPQSISLSATLINKDPEIERIYKTAYPMPERYREGPVDKFTDAYAVRYSVNPRWRYKTSYKEPNYSQNAYEESILKNKEFAVSYCQMIKTFVQAGYVRNHEPGHKAIIFCGTVAMCGHLATYLQNAYPQFNVKRYVAEDPYEENYKQPDIRVTTIGSGGTGHDVPGMTDAHLTPGLESIQANIQAFGRLRKIPNKQTRFYFYTNTDIRKHLKYDRSKTQLMRERAKSLTPIAYGELY